MEKRFVLAKRKRINLKVLIILASIVVILLLNYLDDRYGIIGEAGNLLWLILLLFPFFIIAFFIDSIKNHKVIGHVYVNPSNVKIEKSDVMEIIPVEDITGLEFRYKAVSGEPPPSRGLSGLWSSYDSGDGSGNFLCFWYNTTRYKLNIVLETAEDLNAVLHLFRMIEKTHGFRPVITGYSDDE